MSGLADDTLLKAGGIRQRMRCSGQTAHRIEDTFVTVEQMLDAIESDAPLTDVNGIGPKTAETIMDWYKHREEREQGVDSATVTHESSRSATISFHHSWADALGLGGTEGER